MPVKSNPDNYLAVQRSLRRRLLSRSYLPWSEGRDLAAYLLLHLDDLQVAWRCSIEWPHHLMACARADGGFATLVDGIYRPGACEVIDAGIGIVSLAGVRVDNRHPTMQRLWSNRRAALA